MKDENWCAGTNCIMYLVCPINMGQGKKSTYEHPRCPVFENNKELFKTKEQPNER